MNKNSKGLKTTITECFNKTTKAHFFSLEFSPKPNFHLNIKDFKKSPLFVAVTWLNDENLQCDPMKNCPVIVNASFIKSTFVVVHLTCCNLTDKKLDEFLKCDGIENIAVFRGDQVSESQPFQHASNLIARIRKKTDNREDFTIFAGCYPDLHPESINVQEAMKYLKKKIETGVDILITQIFFTSQTFIEFVESCRSHQIKVPIIPGIYIPATFQELMRITKITKVKMPQELFESYKVLQLDEEAFQAYSLSNTVRVIKEIKSNSKEHITGFHFFTLNDLHMLKSIIPKIDVTEYTPTEVALF